MAEPEKPIEIDDQGQTAEHEPPKGGNSLALRFERFKAWYLERKKWTIPASVVVFILLLAAIPFTRYPLAGMVLKHDLNVSVIDATADTPVSGATVSFGSISAQTDGSGKAVLHNVKAGHHKIVFSKKYYKDQSVSLLVPILSQKTTPQVHLVATGRQVKISVTNLINKNPLADVDIKVADITAKTDNTGSAIVVLPAGTTTAKATLSLENYNDAEVTVKVSNGQIQANPFTLTPAGKIYFLS